MEILLGCQCYVFKSFKIKKRVFNKHLMKLSIIMTLTEVQGSITLTCDKGEMLASDMIVYIRVVVSGLKFSFVYFRTNSVLCILEQSDLHPTSVCQYFGSQFQSWSSHGIIIGCGGYIFVSLFCMSKTEHFRNKGKKFISLWKLLSFWR